MNDSFVTVVIRRCVQIGEHEYTTRRYSRNFHTSRSINYMLGWAKAMGIENASIHDLEFFDYTGGSV